MSNKIKCSHILVEKQSQYLEQHLSSTPLKILIEWIFSNTDRQSFSLKL